MTNLTLHFEINPSSLRETVFSHQLIVEPRRAVRGNSGQLFNTSNTFPWSSAVKALSLLFLGYFQDEWFVLEGGVGSPASTLDYALSKKPLWVTDMFGLSQRGEHIISKIIRRWNPGRKRGNLVRLAINSSVLSRTSIEI